jgi:hypothetical protein
VAAKYERAPGHLLKRLEKSLKTTKERFRVGGKLMFQRAKLKGKKAKCQT